MTKYTYKVWHDSTVYECCVMFSVKFGSRVVVKDRQVSVRLIDALFGSNNAIKSCLKRGKLQAEDLIKTLQQNEITNGE